MHAVARRAPSPCATRPSWRATRAAFRQALLQRARADRPAVGGARRRRRCTSRRCCAPSAGVSAGAENIDLDACARAGVEVVRSLTASARAEAEFMIGALLSLLRRVPVRRLRRHAGRPRARRRAPSAWSAWRRRRARSRSCSARFGSTRRRLRPGAARQRPRLGALAGRAAGPARAARARPTRVCVQLAYFSRYHGLLGDRFLPSLQARTRCSSASRTRACSTRPRWPTALSERPHRRGLVRQPRARRARPGPAAARHRHAAGDAARRRARRASRACAAPGRWRGASTSCSRRTPSAPRRVQVDDARRARLISKPAQRRREVGDPLLLLLDHRGRRAGDEALVAELGVAPWRSRPRARSISLPRRAHLGGDVDLHVQRQPRVARPPPPATSLAAARERRLVVEHLHLATACASAFSSGAASRDEAGVADRVAAAPARPATGSSRCAGCGTLPTHRLQLRRSRRRPAGRSCSSCACG